MTKTEQLDKLQRAWGGTSPPGPGAGQAGDGPAAEHPRLHRLFIPIGAGECGKPHRGQRPSPPPSFSAGMRGRSAPSASFSPIGQGPEDFLALAEEGPVRALRCTYSADAGLTHRDFLGAILGQGISRERLGDLLVGPERCDLIVLEELAGYLLQNLDSAGAGPAEGADHPPLGAGAAGGEGEAHPGHRGHAPAGRGGGGRLFHLPAGKAADLIAAGRVQLNYRECGKTDRLVAEGGRPLLPWAGQGRGKGTGRPLQKGPRHAGTGALAVRRRYFPRERNIVMITQAQIDRINALARKAKTPEGLTPEETEGRGPPCAGPMWPRSGTNLVGQLEKTYIVEPDGTKRRLTHKDC